MTGNAKRVWCFLTFMITFEYQSVFLELKLEFEYALKLELEFDRHQHVPFRIGYFPYSESNLVFSKKQCPNPFGANRQKHRKRFKNDQQNQLGLKSD